MSDIRSSPAMPAARGACRVPELVGPDRAVFRRARCRGALAYPGPTESLRNPVRPPRAMQSWRPPPGPAGHPVPRVWISRNGMRMAGRFRTAAVRRVRRLEPISALVDAWIFARQMDQLFSVSGGARAARRSRLRPCLAAAMARAADMIARPRVATSGAAPEYRHARHGRCSVAAPGRRGRTDSR